MRQSLLVVVALFSAGSGSVRAGELPAGRQYVIDARIVTHDRAGKEAVLAAPRIITVENNAASIRVGSQMARPGRTRQIEWLDEGVAIELKVFTDEDGKRFLDVHAQCTERQAHRPRTCGALLLAQLPDAWRAAAHSNTAGVRLVTRAIRLVEPLRTGEKLTAGIDDRTTFVIHVAEAKVNGLEPAAAFPALSASRAKSVK